jgi:hypothetical protein
MPAYVIFAESVITETQKDRRGGRIVLKCQMRIMGSHTVCLAGSLQPTSFPEFVKESRHICPSAYIYTAASRFGFQAFFPNILAISFDSLSFY